MGCVIDRECGMSGKRQAVSRQLWFEMQGLSWILAPA
jgi:hypothetical protein